MWVRLFVILMDLVGLVHQPMWNITKSGCSTFCLVSCNNIKPQNKPKKSFKLIFQQFQWINNLQNVLIKLNENVLNRYLSFKIQKNN